jgi:hypothetical protein
LWVVGCGLWVGVDYSQPTTHNQQPTTTNPQPTTI